MQTLAEGIDTNGEKEPPSKRRKESFSVISEAHTTVSTASTTASTSVVSVPAITSLPLPAALPLPLPLPSTACIDPPATEEVLQLETSKISTSTMANSKLENDEKSTNSTINNTANKSHSSHNPITQPNPALNPPAAAKDGETTEMRDCAFKAVTFLHKLLFRKMFTVQGDQMQERERPQSHFLYRLLTAQTVLCAHSVLFDFLRCCRDSPPSQETLPVVVIASVFLAGKVGCSLRKFSTMKAISILDDYCLKRRKYY